ncbi:hypothetical protein KUCAC02_019363 [Chaenocephalus aceratus]|uniref:Uncharacterized protein n=1 Tax=Chaenocephalus aceratus TaxID=36190 RepID=A0ACB9VNA5_CHAAC|nr:hypothetical protein KUCAC02_019363 [Chaenocephalus aceratus]
MGPQEQLVSEEETHRGHQRDTHGCEVWMGPQSSWLVRKRHTGDIRETLTAVRSGWAHRAAAGTLVNWAVRMQRGSCCSTGNPRGTYLIRESETTKGAFSLSIRTGTM